MAARMWNAEALNSHALVTWGKQHLLVVFILFFIVKLILFFFAGLGWFLLPTAMLKWYTAWRQFKGKLPKTFGWPALQIFTSLAYLFFVVIAFWKANIRLIELL